MIVNASNDDFLCAYLYDYTYISLGVHLKGYFYVTTKQAAEFEYLNLHII